MPGTCYYRLVFQIDMAYFSSAWADSSAGQSAALTRKRSQVRPLFRLPLIYLRLLYGAVGQPGLGRQIVNLEVAGSNPVGPAIFFCPWADGRGIAISRA